MREGQVEGNISCRELIIDGKVQGQCRGDSITIEEHGNLDDTLAYRSLAIKRAASSPAAPRCWPRRKAKSSHRPVAEDGVMSARPQSA